jgi:putative Mg2+ transporter-C (MgtC) family protein
VTISQLELVIRLLVAVVLCGLIGMEREARDQVAGLRTHMLVGVGAALFTLVSAYAFENFAAGGAGALRPDPTRIAAQIVSGIGFLGAGAIIRQGFNVRGVTTAAALWISAAIGMAAGAGYYVGAVATTVIVLAALIIFRILRPQLMSRMRTDYVLLDLNLRHPAELSDVFGLLFRHGVRVEGMSSEREADIDNVRIELRVPAPVELTAVLEGIRGIEGVVSASVTGVRSTHTAAE